MASYTSILMDMLRQPTRPPPTWNPNKDMASLRDRVVIVTGPTSGIGYETLRQLVLSSAHVYLFGRSIEKLQQTKAMIVGECQAALDKEYKQGDLRYGAKVGKMSLIQCDLSSLSSVQAAAKEFLALESRVDIVFANAGIMESNTTTKDGYEIMFGTNVLGHHALLRLLWPALVSSAQTLDSATTGITRVVFTSSGTHKWVDQPSHLDVSTLADAKSTSLSLMHLYGRSKLGNIYTAQKLQSLSDRDGLGITICSVHPGGVKSSLGSKAKWITSLKNLFLVDADLGALTQLWAGCAAPANHIKGSYLVPWATVAQPSPLAQNIEVQQQVWDWCEQQCLKHGLVDKVIE